VDFGGLAVGVSCGDALAKGLQAAHPLTGSRLRANDERFRLDAAAGAVPRPARPECPSVAPRRAGCRCGRVRAGSLLCTPARSFGSG
jgi:hypothetical protein